MKTLSKAVAVASLLSAGIMSAQVANAEVSYNAAVVSDYVFRGVSFSDNGFALQGGADYSHESGAYAGIWASTIDATDDEIEYDYYFGFATEMNGLELDAGYVTYNGDDAGLTNAEIYATVAKDAISAGLYIDIEVDNNMYLEGGYSMDLPNDLGQDLHACYTLPDDSAADNVFDLGATVGKSLEMVDVSVTVTFIDEDGSGDSEVLGFLMVSKEF